MLRTLRFARIILLALSALSAGLFAGLWLRSYHAADYWLVWKQSQLQTNGKDPALYRKFDLFRIGRGRMYFECRDVLVDYHDDWDFEEAFRSPFAVGWENPPQVYDSKNIKSKAGIRYVINYEPTTSGSLRRYRYNSPYNEIEYFAFVSIPFWQPTLIFFLIPAVFFIWRRWFPWRLKNKRWKRNLCLHCGYDLRATPDRCPECGEVRTPDQHPHFPARGLVQWSLIAAAVVVLAWCAFPIHLRWLQYQFLRAQTRCAECEYPPTRVMYEFGPATAPSPDFQDAYPISHANVGAGTNEWVCPTPAIWLDLCMYGGADWPRDFHPLFLHLRKTRAGIQRIVAVVPLSWMQSIETDRSPELRTWRLKVLFYTPGTRGAPPEQDWETSVIELGPLACKKLDIFAGQANPSDASHFTISYEADGRAGKLECYLTDTDNGLIDIKTSR